MKALFLNCWYGNVGQPFIDFVKKHSVDTDVFCLTEITPNLHKVLTNMLSDFEDYFAYDSGLENASSSQLILVRKGMNVSIYNKKLLYKTTDVYGGREVPAFVQGLTLANSLFSIFNLHGMAYPAHKMDIDLRIKQSEDIIKFASDFLTPHIIFGDFNLLPETKSIKMFEDLGYRNLIKDFNIKKTRNKLADHTKNDKSYVGKQHFADYCFVSKEIKVVDFKVPKVLVSDHLPLILWFTL